MECQFVAKRCIVAKWYSYSCNFSYKLILHFVSRQKRASALFAGYEEDHFGLKQFLDYVHTFLSGEICWEFSVHVLHLSFLKMRLYWKCVLKLSLILMCINIQQISQFETYISSGKYVPKLTVHWTLSGTIVKISTQGFLHLYYIGCCY